MGFCRFSPYPRIWSGCLLAAFVAGAAPQRAAATDPVQLVLTDHRFRPDHITVAADERFRIELTNHDDTTDEFESYDMKFEKIVVSGGRIAVFAEALRMRQISVCPGCIVLVRTTSSGGKDPSGISGTGAPFRVRVVTCGPPVSGSSASHVTSFA